MVYEINKDTLAILPEENNSSRIIEMDREFVIPMKPTKVIDLSCRYFGSSYEGRFEGTKSMLGISYKAPIIIEEAFNFIFFPTSSPRIEDCSWVSINAIVNYYSEGYSTIVILKNGEKIKLNISLPSLENQMFRATKLENLIKNRKKSFLKKTEK